MNSKNRFILINLLTFEFVLLNLVLNLYLYFRVPEFSYTDTTFFIDKIVPLTIIYNLSWLIIILYIRDKDFYFNTTQAYLKSLLISLFFFVGFVTTLVILFKIRYFARSTFIAPIFIFTYLNLISLKYIIKYLKKRGSKIFSTAILVGSYDEFQYLNNFTKIMAHYGYNVLGYLEDKDKNSKNLLGLPIVGNIKDLSNVLTNNDIDEIFIDMSVLKRKKIKKLLRIADSYGVRVKLIPEYPLLIAQNCKALTIGDLAVFKVRQSPLDNLNMTILKRLFDFCFALVVIILCSPLFLLIGILVYCTSKGPIFYTPYRKGEAGETFKCYKFRTMSVCDDPVNGTKSTIVNDPRITPIGKFLRKSDLDELPQFINVLKGDMSVIGPRPHRSNLQTDLRRSVRDYMVRSYVKPGITGWAQVNGWRGPTITDEQKSERIRHDLWYIENWSFWLDIKVIFMTLFGRHRKKAF